MGLNFNLLFFIPRLVVSMAGFVVGAELCTMPERQRLKLYSIIKKKKILGVSVTDNVPLLTP